MLQSFGKILALLLRFLEDVDILSTVASIMDLEKIRAAIRYADLEEAGGWELRLASIYTGPCRACLDYSVYIFSMLRLRFLSVPSAPGWSLWCRKHTSRHQSWARYLTPFTRFP